MGVSGIMMGDMVLLKKNFSTAPKLTSVLPQNRKQHSVTLEIETLKKKHKDVIAH